MIELNIVSNELLVENLYVKRINNVLIKNYHTLYTFICSFFDLSKIKY